MATKTAKTTKDAEKPAKDTKAKAPAKAPAKAKAAKTAEADAKTSTKGPNAALKKPLTPSKDLAVIVGAAPLARTEVVSKVWEYIRKHNLQNPVNKREILADPSLKAVFGKDSATMFEMNKLLSAHLA